MTDSKITYPQLISEDLQGFKSEQNEFINFISGQMSLLKKHFSDMRFDKDFDKDIWPKLANGSIEFLQIMAHEKVEGIKKFLGIPDGVTVRETVTHLNASIDQIRSVITRMQSGHRPVNSPKYSYSLSDIELVDGSLKIKEQSYLTALESYRVYINSEEEQLMIDSVNEFGKAYNKFIDDLQSFRFKHFSDVTPTFLGQLFKPIDGRKLEAKKAAHHVVLRSRSM